MGQRKLLRRVFPKELLPNSTFHFIYTAFPTSFPSPTSFSSTTSSSIIYFTFIIYIICITYIIYINFSSSTSTSIIDFMYITFILYHHLQVLHVYIPHTTPTMLFTQEFTGVQWSCYTELNF
jgi:hypothetical protein